MKRAGLKTALRVALLLLILVFLIVTVVVKRSVLSSSFHALTGFQFIWLVPALLAEGASMLSATINHKRLLAVAGRTVGMWPMTAITYASNAFSVSIPLAGREVATVFTFGQWRKRGVGGGEAAWTLTFAGLFSTISFGSLLSVGALVSGNLALVLGGVVASLFTLIPLVLILLSLRSQSMNEKLTTWWTRLSAFTSKKTHRQLPALDKLVYEVLVQMKTLRLPYKEALLILGIALLNWTTDLLCLIICLHAVGVVIPWAGIILVYAAGVGAYSVGLVPGGVGIVEVVLLGALLKAGIPGGPALAGVLAYRLISFWLVAMLGWLSALLLHVRKQSASPEG